MFVSRTVPSLCLWDDYQLAHQTKCETGRLWSQLERLFKNTFLWLRRMQGYSLHALRISVHDVHEIALLVLRGVAMHGSLQPFHLSSQILF